MGIGIASFFGAAMKNSTLAFKIPWQLLAIAGLAVAIICVLSAMLSIRKVISLEPAIVFKG
jgi:putative ABC transport system permease protein